MNTNSKYISIPILVVCLIISGCRPGQLFGPTLTPLPTITPSPTATPIPTRTSTPTQTSIPIPTSSYIPVPRWMMLDRPPYNVNILGEKWKYTNDRWGDTYGCIDYTREKEPYLFFEECFAYIAPDLTFETQRDAFLNDGFEVLTPKSKFGGVGQISLVAKRLVDNSTKFVKFLQLIGTEQYILLVEMNYVIDDQAPLQTIYEKETAETIDYALQNMLEKSHLMPRPTATPLSSNQQDTYQDLSPKLITESEASEIYTATWVGEKEGSVDGTWEALGDRVPNNRSQVCRVFEDRTNVDVRWVSFQNCVLQAKEFPFESFAQYCTQPEDTVVESSHKYKGNFLICAHDYTQFDAFLIDGEYIYAVSVESRMLSDYKDAFTQTVDDFIYDVLMVNMQR